MIKIFLFQAIQSCQTVLIQTIQFSRRMQLVLFNPYIGLLSGSDGNEGVLCITQSSSIIGTSSSDCLVPYLGHSLGGSLIPLQRDSRCILQPQPTGQSYFWRGQMIIKFTKTKSKKAACNNYFNQDDGYLSLPPTRHDLTQGQKPEGRLKWG